MRVTRSLTLISFLLFLFAALSFMVGCSGQSEEPLLELSNSQPSLLLFYTEN
jgi:hypothetical protein